MAVYRLLSKHVAVVVQSPSPTVARQSCGCIVETIKQAYHTYVPACDKGTS